MVSDPCKVIKRAINPIQSKTKRWWALHPDSPTNIALVNTATMYRAKDTSKILLVGILRWNTEYYVKDTISQVDMILAWSLADKKWILIEIHKMQLDSAEGRPYWRDCLIDYEADEKHYSLIQGAVCAATGLSDDNLAKKIHVRKSTIRKWYRDGIIMQTKHIEQIIPIINQ